MQKLDGCLGRNQVKETGLRGRQRVSVDSEWCSDENPRRYCVEEVSGRPWAQVGWRCVMSVDLQFCLCRWSAGGSPRRIQKQRRRTLVILFCRWRWFWADMQEDLRWVWRWFRVREQCGGWPGTRTEKPCCLEGSGESSLKFQEESLRRTGR